MHPGIEWCQFRRSGHRSLGQTNLLGTRRGHDHFIRRNVVEVLAWPNVMLMAID
jgi:hypothetical protein